MAPRSSAIRERPARRSRSSPKRGLRLPTSTPWVSTAQTPTNAKKKALVEASHPKRALEKSGKLVRSPAKDRFSRKTVSNSPRRLLIPSTPRNCDRGLRRRSGVGVRLSGDKDSGRMRKPNAALPKASAEAAKAGTGHKPDAEGGPDQAQPPGAALDRSAVGYVGLGRRQGPARGAGQHDGREQQKERLRQPEQEVGERRAEQAENEDRAASGAVREAAQKRPADELRRGVEGTEQADQRRPRGVLSRVEREEGYHEPVSKHVHEDRDEEERQRRRAPRQAHQG